MNRKEIIQRCVNRIEAKTYLEIGIDAGTTLNAIKAHRKIGVDPKLSLSLGERLKKRIAVLFAADKEIIFRTTSDKFFLKKARLFKTDKIGVAFIDGLHTYEQSLRDVVNCLKHLRPEGIIVLHDCNPPSSTIAYPAANIQEARDANLPDWTGDWCGDVWKTIVYLRSHRNDLSIFVLNADSGVGIITVGKPEDMLRHTDKDIHEMSYGDLELLFPL